MFCNFASVTCTARTGVLLDHLHAIEYNRYFTFLSLNGLMSNDFGQQIITVTVALSIGIGHGS